MALPMTLIEPRLIYLEPAVRNYPRGRELAILNGLADGRSPSEIQETANMSPTNYDSTRRRIRRTLARAFPEKI